MKFLLLFIPFVTSCAFLQQTGPVPNSGTEIPKSEVVTKLPGMSLEWSKVLLTNLQAELPNLNQATDLPRFCPNYAKLLPTQRTVAWGYLVSAIIKRESGYNECSTFKESTGIDSIGFLQLSYGDRFCPKKKSEGNLCDGKVNLACGTKLMGLYVSVDKVVASGGYTKYGAPASKGLAKYWSVIRVPDTKSKHHLQEIIDSTKKAPGCL